MKQTKTTKKADSGVVSEKEIKKLEKELAKIGGGTISSPSPYADGLKYVLSNTLGDFFTDSQGYLYKLIHISKEYNGEVRHETLLKPIKCLNKQ
jgi:hypothetical protein